MSRQIKVDSKTYYDNPERYCLVSGAREGAPRCPYGNAHLWVGYDKEAKQYVRFTKSVFKTLVALKDPE